MLRIIVISGITLLAGSSLFIHPFGNVKAQRPVNAGSLDAMFDPQAAKILQKSCTNCHSENTHWPWYSYVAPMSWMIEYDVHSGRSRMNLSRWSEYSLDERQEQLGKMSILLKRHAMPLPRYLLLHPEARLNEDEIRYLSQWARRESRRLSGSVGSGASR